MCSSVFLSLIDFLRLIKNPINKIKNHQKDYLLNHFIACLQPAIRSNMSGILFENNQNQTNSQSISGCGAPYKVIFFVIKNSNITLLFLKSYKF